MDYRSRILPLSPFQQLAFTLGAVHILHQPTDFYMRLRFVNLLSKCWANTINAFDVMQARMSLCVCVHFSFVGCYIHVSVRLVSSNSTLFQTSPHMEI